MFLDQRNLSYSTLLGAGGNGRVLKTNERTIGIEGTNKDKLQENH